VSYLAASLRAFLRKKAVKGGKLPFEGLAEVRWSKDLRSFLHIVEERGLPIKGFPDRFQGKGRRKMKKGCQFFSGVNGDTAGGCSNQRGRERGGSPLQRAKE